MLDQDQDHEHTLTSADGKLSVTTKLRLVGVRDYHMFIGGLRQPVLRGMVTVCEDRSLVIRVHDSAGRFLGHSKTRPGADEVEAVMLALHFRLLTQ